MYRIIIRRFDHYGKWIVEAGPWHASRHTAEQWAEILRSLGYVVRIEAMAGAPLETGEDGNTASGMV